MPSDEPKDAFPNFLQIGERAIAGAQAHNAPIEALRKERAEAVEASNAFLRRAVLPVLIRASEELAQLGFTVDVEPFWGECHAEGYGPAFAGVGCWRTKSNKSKSHRPSEAICTSYETDGKSLRVLKWVDGDRVRIGDWQTVDEASEGEAASCIAKWVEADLSAAAKLKA